MSLQSRIRNVTAVLGPTNTGKTHLAIERMLGHPSGMIGLPLRLLAREVYDKIAVRAGVNNVALITGEEKIKPESPRFWVSTVEAMPRDVQTDFLAIDEVQLCADPERGHVFTDRLLHARGREETLLLGAGTMREAINELIPGANFISRPRLSKITYSGQKKITRLPKRTAIVAFSAAEVYEIAELIRRQLGGAAVVLGALSPRTRNAQVAMYQSGDIDYLVATDAIGMGLNLDVDHVAFAATRKFDGHSHRNLTPSELGQIAGRAGRHMNDGTFGVTGDCEPLEADMIERLETHTFDTVKNLQWRNPNLDCSTLERLRESLREMPREQRLQRARMADDVLALETVSADREIAARANTPKSVERLWEVCQVPDYRKISSQNHAELVATLYGFLMSDAGRIPEDWFAKQVEMAARTDGDIDTLANRIAHIRTWTFVSNRADWLADHAHWQERTRAIEDSLSDALHEQLTQRFVDLKTSALMRGLRAKEDLSAEIASDGAIHVESHFVGRLKGFRFQPDFQAEAQGIHAKASRGAAAHVLSGELAMRARRVASAKADAFKLTRQGRVLWRDEEIAQIEAGDDPLKPTITLLADEHLTAPDREKVQTRLDTWIAELIGERLKPLTELKAAEDIQGLARGIAFRMVENFGSLKRETVAEDMKQLDQPSRAQLRKYGVRFGAFNIYLPLLLKPAAAELTLTLWALKHGAAVGLDPENLPEPPRAGLTSAPATATTPEPFIRAVGYHLCGPRAIRMDILERLADIIRPLLAYRITEVGAVPPKGSSGDGGFIVTPEMMSVLGCSQDELGNVLRALGFRSEKKPAPPKAKPAHAAQAAPVAAVPDEAAAATAAPAPEAVGGPEGAAEPTSAAAEVASEAGSSAAMAPASEPAAAEISAVNATDTAIAAAAPEAEVSAAAPTDSATGSAADAEVAVPVQQAGEPAAADAPVELEMIEIWRPRRRDRGERRDHHGRGDQRRQHQRHGRGGRDHRHRDRRPNGQQPVAAQTGEATVATGADAPTTPTAVAGGEVPAATVEAQAGDTRVRHGRDRHGDRRQHRDHRGDRNRGQDQNREKRGEGEHRGPRRDDRRGDRRDDRRNERPRQEFRSSGPQRKGGPDPDSPFAALSALKQQLEKQAKERS